MGIVWQILYWQGGAHHEIWLCAHFNSGPDGGIGGMLEAAGCEEIIREHASAVGRREAFEILMQHKLRRGDMLVVTKMDRLARSISRLLTIVETLKDKGVDLMILDFNKGESINTNSPTGKLMLTMFGAFAEFERSNMLERQRWASKRPSRRANTPAASRPR